MDEGHRAGTVFMSVCGGDGWPDGGEERGLIRLGELVWSGVLGAIVPAPPLLASLYTLCQNCPKLRLLLELGNLPNHLLFDRNLKIRSVSHTSMIMWNEGYCIHNQQG